MITQDNLRHWFNYTEAEAHAAYMGASAILHSEFWVGNRSDYQSEAAAAITRKA
jgi:hypothetical protein